MHSESRHKIPMVGITEADECSAPECSVLCQLLIARRQRVAVIGCHGLTLVELIVVMAVLGVLASMAIPSFREYIKVTKINACASDLRIIDKAVTAYYIERNVLPVELSDVGLGSHQDPWKRQYEFKNLSIAGNVPLQDSAGEVLNHDYDLYCKGGDGESFPVFGNPANEDDIVRANDGFYIGGRP
jgi:general secretion pathway protein G